jgi:hypothetical protein
VTACQHLCGTDCVPTYNFLAAGQTGCCVLNISMTRLEVASCLLHNSDDPQIKIRNLSPLFKEKGRQIRPAKEPRHIQNEKCGREARARGAVFQALSLNKPALCAAQERVGSSVPCYTCRLSAVPKFFCHPAIEGRDVFRFPTRYHTKAFSALSLTEILLS